MKFNSLLFLSFASSFLMLSCNQNGTVKEVEHNYPETPAVKSVSVKGTNTIFFKMPELPKELFFAGERVPLEREDVQLKLMDELILHANRHGRILITMHKMPFWEQIVRAELLKNGVPEDLIYLAIAESDFDENAISPVGATGMWQIMKATAQEYGLVVNAEVDERRDVEKATKVASQFLLKSKERFGSWALACSAYNRGANGIGRALEGQKVTSFYELYLNPETSRYFYRILATKLIYENPEAYGFQFDSNKIKPCIGDRCVPLEEGEYNSIEIANKYGMNFSQLKEYNPWIIDASDYQFRIKKSQETKLRIK